MIFFVNTYQFNAVGFSNRKSLRFMANNCRARKYHTDLIPENEMAVVSFAFSKHSYISKPFIIGNHIQIGKITNIAMQLTSGWTKMKMVDNDFVARRQKMILLKIYYV